MEILLNAAGGFIVEVGKSVCKCIYPKIENTVHFSSNIENLREEMEKLRKFRDDIKGKVEGAVGEGYKPKPDVLKWLEDVEKLENEWETMQESITAAKTLACKCCPKCSLRSEVSTQARNVRDQLCRLKEVGENFGSNLVVENYQMKKVEFIPVTSIEGQSAATRNLNKILQLLEDDKVCIIGVWGTGGIGKTTLVKNLNNELVKTVASSSKLSFGVVVWVTVPKPPIDIRNVQAQIANRLNIKVDNEESLESISSKIYPRLKQEKSFLLILDDVWEVINLDHVGVPQLEDTIRSKVIITSRFLSVCKQMKADTKMNVSKLDEDESWHLFVKNAGGDANLENIQPLAKEIARECDGLPLAITVIGTSMRGKTRVELWEDALKSLRMSEPDKDVQGKVYKVIKWSFDSLVSQDVELSSEKRSKPVKKRRGDIQSCFLYCSLYPDDISTDDLIHCWWAEGFLGEHDTYAEAYNRGITMIENLKDACLLEAPEMDYVKMHDVVRDVARWIANSSGNERNSLIQAGIGLTDISHIKMSTYVKRISFVSNRIRHLPDYFTKCPETTTLLLQDNIPLEKIPHEFFLAFPALRVVNLSNTSIRVLPSSINSLYQLHVLILQYCKHLTELPPIGNLHNLQVLDCDNARLHCLPQGMDKLTNLRLLNLPVASLESISQGFFLNLSSIEMLNMLGNRTEVKRENLLGPTSFNELSSLHNLTSLFIGLDSSSIFKGGDYTWMTRLKRFHIEVGEYRIPVEFNKSRRMIVINECEIFSNGELSGMLQFASDLVLVECRDLRKLFAYNRFDGLKSLYIYNCYCDFGPVEEGSGQFDPLPNLEFLHLKTPKFLESVFDFSQLLGLRFSKLHELEIVDCDSLTCLFLSQCGSSEAILVNSEIPKVQKLKLQYLPKLGILGEPQSMWEHLEELSLLNCNEIRKLPFSIQTSKNIKVIRGELEWWSQLEWDDDSFKSNLEHCFQPYSNWDVFAYLFTLRCVL